MEVCRDTLLWRTNSWKCLLAITRWLYHWPHRKRDNNIHDYRELNKKTRAFWFCHASSKTFAAMRSGKLKNYVIHDEDGVAIIVTWATRGLGHHYGHRRLPAILAKTCFTKVIMQDVHKVDH